MIKAVIFDWGGTLTPWHTVDAGEAWSAGAGDPELGRRLFTAELELWQRSQQQHRSGTMHEIFAAAGLPYDPEVVARYHAWWEPHTYVDPDAAPLMTALRARGIKVGVLSNTLWHRAEHERIFARDGIAELIDADIYTSDIAWTKPHPEAFGAALAALGVSDPGSAVFVGDRPWDDIHGARSAGLRTILVPHSEIPESQRGPVEAEADAVVQRLAEVLTHVDLWNKQSGDLGNKRGDVGSSTPC
ncbi:HAD family hydrolase [Jatrophihabitans sp.]|uniref:HAD family hydrolase n=1 Tax=Jatrophihabitans sp. TaxID=1932789 RepID=UPI0030C778BD